MAAQYTTNITMTYLLTYYIDIVSHYLLTYNSELTFLFPLLLLFS